MNPAEPQPIFITHLQSVHNFWDVQTNDALHGTWADALILLRALMECTTALQCSAWAVDWHLGQMLIQLVEKHSKAISRGVNVHMGQDLESCSILLHRQKRQCISQ